MLTYQSVIYITRIDKPGCPMAPACPLLPLFPVNPANPTNPVAPAAPTRPECQQTPIVCTADTSQRFDIEFQPQPQPHVVTDSATKSATVRLQLDGAFVTVKT